MVTLRNERGLASLKTRGVIAQVLLGLFLLVTVLVALSALMLAWQEVRTTYSAYMISQPIFASYITLAFIPAAIALSVWAWRAHANLEADALDELAYSPMKAVLALWTPGANLVIPKAAMRELWNRSHGEEPWFAQQSVDAVNSWWTCYVCGIVILTLLTLMVLIDRLTNLAFVTPPGANMLVLAFSSLLLAASAWFLIRIIGRISRAQETVTTVGDTFA